MTLILGLESSCDETAAAVVEDGLRVRSNVIASQHDLHAKYRGVVPEIASRAHLERIDPVITEALSQANVTLADIDAIAVGNRPGLIGSLLVGVAAAKALAWSLAKPLIGVDHVRAHLYAGLMQLTPSDIPHSTSHIAHHFPALGLVVSGGHTSLYHLDSPLSMQVIGRTIDDAVGEAYDKAAVILGVPYPGGPNLDKLAQTGDAAAVDPLPISLLDEGSLDFSFSGLKTSLLYRVRGQPIGRGRDAKFERSCDDLSETERRDIAAAFQRAAIGAVITKLERAIDRMTADGGAPRTILVGGGVSANSLLRRSVVELGQRRSIDVRVPAMKLCLDNAAMIAGLAYESFAGGRFDDLSLAAVATTAV